MPKNIVICCDGTANEFAADRTNVVKLFFTLAKDSSDQVAFYHPGIGTMEPPGALSPWRRRFTRLLGQAIGYGLENDIRDAYAFIMNNFDEGDRLYMFGFSRGAYTVRAVASLLHMYGLIRRGNEPLIPYAIRMMVGISRQSRNDGGDAAKAAFELARQFRSHFAGIECKPHFVGVFDTVSSVGWIENPLRLPYTSNNPDIRIGRHAIAIDEKRAFFRSNLWHPAPGTASDILQVWFPGVHCDVGGGYPEQESGLSKIALRWMLCEAAKAELIIDRSKADVVLGETGADYVKPSVTGPMHESLTPSWYPAEFVFKRHYDWSTKQEERRMNLFRRRTIPPKSFVHSSAYEIGPEYARRLPADAVRVD